jgi:hypothetical protein
MFVEANIGALGGLRSIRIPNSIGPEHAQETQK